MNAGPIRRITISLFATQGIFSAAMVAAFTVMAIIAADLSGSRAWAGVPILSMFVGRFLASYMMGRLMDQWGRRPALVAAFAIGVVGAGLAVTAVMARSFGGFVLAALVFGMARGGAEQMRFIAAEIQAPGQRARAIGLIVFAGTIGSIAGPWFYQLTSSAASSRGYDPSVGPWAIAALLMGLGAVVLFVTLRPDPRELGRRIEAATSAAGNVSARAMTTIFALPRVRLAVISIAIGQVVMTILMSVTPLHMIQEGFQAGDISVVMAAHMLGMFGLAPLTGRLVDRIGPYWMIGLGALTLVITSGLALVAVGLESLAAALFMLGLGWNLTFVAGSALLMNMVTQAERARSQGVAEMINSVAGGLAALGSGLLLELGGMPMLAVGGLVLTGILIAAQTWILAIRAHLRPIGAESASAVAVEAD
jgi:MFS family permease